MVLYQYPNISPRVSRRILTATSGVSVLMSSTFFNVSFNPEVIELLFSKNEISDEVGADSSTVSFKCTTNIEEWEARATDKNGSFGVGMGNLVGSGGPVNSGTVINFTVDDEELILGDIEYQITIYVKANGIWY
jgi:hypothetical protein